MKINSIILFFLFLLACSAKTNQIDKKAERADQFNNLLRRLKPIELPYIFRLTDKNATVEDNMESLNLKTADSLFYKSDDMDIVNCLGYLTDTSKFYSLIFMLPADNFYPFLVTYTKSGKIISQNDLLANGCGVDCGLLSYSENSIIQKDFSIFCSDTAVWEYFCDSVGQPIPNSAETWIFYKQGKISNDGIINIGKAKHLVVKNNP